MKKLTMTKVLTPLAALAFALGAQATAVSTDGFETETSTVVTNRTGWSFAYGGDGADDASAITAYGEATTPAVLPDGMTAGDNFLKLSTEDGILFRNMDGDAGESVDLYQGLYVDTDVQFTLTDKSDRPAATSDDKFIIWLEADEDAGTTNLCVWAREYKVENETIVANSNKVYKLNSGNIVPGSWHRLTVKACQSINTSPAIPGFQVFLDGSNTPLTSNVDGMESTYFLPDDQLGSSGLLDVGAQALFNARTFFPAMADTLETLTKVGFSGEGAIDNLVVTRDLPGFTEPTTVRFDFDMDVIASIDIASLGATLTSTNETIAVASDATFTFEINWKSGYSASMFNIATSHSGYATVSDYTVTATGFGLGVITVTTTAKDTTDVTFNWEALNTAMGEQVTENTGISFTIGETVYNVEDLENDTTKTITGVKTGTNILVTVEFSNNKWVATIPTIPECMSRDGMTLTLNQRPSSGDVTVYLSAEAAPSPVTVNGTGYDTLAEALAAAVSGDTITFNTDVAAAAATLTTAASTIDLNGHTLICSAIGNDTITFTGLGAATIKGGVVSNCYDTLTINSPSGQNLTLDGVTFHCTVKPQTASAADLLLVTNCVFLCDIARDGTTVAGANYHSYGVQLVAASRFAIADIIGNAFEHPRRSALQITFTGDTYVYGNSFDATKLTTYYNGGSSGDGNELFPEMQIYAQGRIFIENNTFTGQYMTGAFGFYNKTSNKSTAAALVFNGNTVDASVPYLWTYYVDIASGGATNVTGDLVMPDVYFGANTIGSGVDTTQGCYKELVQPVPTAYTATLALPTGVDTVYDWTHGANAGKMYVSGTGVTGFVNDLSEVAAGDTVTAVPGEVPVKANFSFTPGALKNQYTAALASYTITYMYGDSTLTGLTPATYTTADAVTLPTVVDLGVVGVGFAAWTNAEGTVVASWAAGDKTGDLVFYAQTAAVVPSGEELKPGEQSSTTYDSQAAAEEALANVTIAAADAVTNVLDAAAQETYLAKFEKKVVPAAEAGKYMIEIALKAEAAAELADEATTNVAVAVAAQLPTIAAAAVGSQTEIAVTGVVPGFYYSISYGTAVNAITTEGARELAPASGSITLQTPAKASGATTGFYRVNVNVAPKAE